MQVVQSLGNGHFRVSPPPSAGCWMLNIEVGPAGRCWSPWATLVIPALLRVAASIDTCVEFTPKTNSHRSASSELRGALEFVLTRETRFRNRMCSPTLTWRFWWLLGAARRAGGPSDPDLPVPIWASVPSCRATGPPRARASRFACLLFDGLCNPSACSLPLYTTE